MYLVKDSCKLLHLSLAFLFHRWVVFYSITLPVWLTTHLLNGILTISMLCQLQTQTKSRKVLFSYRNAYDCVFLQSINGE